MFSTHKSVPIVRIILKHNKIFSFYRNFSHFSPPRVEFCIRLFIQTFCGHKNAIFVECTIQIQARLPAFCSFSVFFRAEKQNTLKKTGSGSALKTVSQQKRFFVSYSHLGKKNTRTLSNLSIALLQHHDKVANHDCWPAQLEMYFVTMSNKYYRCMTSRSLFHWRNGSETIVENFDFFLFTREVVCVM